MIRVRFPLAAKMAALLALNLAVLGIAGWLLFRSQFSTGFNTFLSATAAPRVEALAESVTHGLRPLPRSEWTERLSALSNHHGVEIAVYENGGDWVAGARLTPPEPVLAQLANPRAGGARPLRDPGPPGRPHGGPGRPERRNDFERPRDRPPPGPEFDGEPGPPRERGFPPPPAARPRGGFETSTPDALGGSPREVEMWPKFLVKTERPTAYWIGIRAPLADTRPPNLPPVSILIRCNSLGQGGLLLETKPLLLAAGGVLLISMLFWVPFAIVLTRNLRRITAATADVARGHFDVQLKGHRRDELGELALSVSAMAGQLDALVRGQKRFLGDVAHELCSPLARMQAALAIAEQRAADEKQARYLATLREELDDMSRLVDELLNFSRATGQREIELRTIPLAQLVAETIAREAPDAQVEWDVPEGLAAKGEPRLLARALGNVLRNAIRYAGAAGPIVISAAPEGDRVSLVVADNGPGVPVESLPRLFDAFYRPDTARTRETGGTGLGLAIVKTCVEACRGTVAVRLGEPSGLEVCFSLPAAA